MKKILKSPFDLVAEVLEIKRELINEKSAIRVTPNWESLNHMIIIGEMEKNYGITVSDSEIEKYETMKAIIKVYEEQSGNISLKQRIIKAFKKIQIGKIFYK